MTKWVADPNRVKEILERISPTEVRYCRYLATARKVTPEAIAESAGLRLPPTLEMWESKTFHREFLVARMGALDEHHKDNLGFPKAFMLPGHITGLPVIFTPQRRKESALLWTGMMEHEGIHVAQEISHPSRKSNPSSPTQELPRLWRKVQMEAEAFYLERALWRHLRDTKNPNVTLEAFAVMLAIEAGVRTALMASNNPLALMERLCETPSPFEDRVRALGVQESLVRYIAGYIEFCTNEVVGERLKSIDSSNKNIHMGR